MDALSKRLSEIRERAEAATEGPWIRTGHKNNPFHPDVEWTQVVERWPRETGHIAFADSISDRDKENTEFVAHARTDVPALLRALELAIEQRDTILPQSTNYVRGKKQQLDAALLAALEGK